MSFLLDTNICSALLRRPGKLAHRFVQHGGSLCIPTIVMGELLAWAFKRPDPTLLLATLEQDLFPELIVLDFDQSCALQFGRIRGTLLLQGRVVNPVDLMIAAVALTYDLTLVTHNTKDFEHVPGLRFVDQSESFEYCNWG